MAYQNGSQTEGGYQSIDVSFSTQLQNDLSAAAKNRLVSPRMQQYLDILMDINLQTIIQMCQNNNETPIIEVNFEESNLRQPLPRDDIDRYQIALQWHAPILFSLLANSGSQRASKQLLVIISMILQEKNIIVVGDMNLD